MHGEGYKSDANNVKNTLLWVCVGAGDKFLLNFIVGFFFSSTPLLFIFLKISFFFRKICLCTMSTPLRPTHIAIKESDFALALANIASGSLSLESLEIGEYGRR